MSFVMNRIPETEREYNRIDKEVIIRIIDLLAKYDLCYKFIDWNSRDTGYDMPKEDIKKLDKEMKELVA